jgi:outer membrane protein OmpA-like peptidoglycan-associated protein
MVRLSRIASSLTIVCLVLLASLYAEPARAESGRFNLHFDAGVLLPPVGGYGNVAFDWQLAQPVALELALGGGATGDDFGTYGLFTAVVGARIRLLDDESGYPSEGGSVHGHLFIAPHVGFGFMGFANGFASGAGPAFVFDVGVGYELSVASPVSIGLYARPIFSFSDLGFGVLFTGGVTVSIEIDPLRGPVDPDRDHDGVLNAEDRCPRTPEGTAVDARGCVPVVEVLVLEGITFLFDSAEIQPGHEDDLLEAARMLEDNPEVRVEIGGHTDDVGDPSHNERLSQDRAQSVAEWLVAHGIERSRLRVRGYGMSAPRVPNTDEASRARNRRIEFRVLSR